MELVVYNTRYCPLRGCWHGGRAAGWRGPALPARGLRGTNLPGSEARALGAQGASRDCSEIPGV